MRGERLMRTFCVIEGRAGTREILQIASGKTGTGQPTFLFAEPWANGARQDSERSQQSIASSLGKRPAQRDLGDR